MKVGMDGVLLGAWTPINNKVQTILDVGTGSGLIALMLAQRSTAHIDAIDIDSGAIEQANVNVQASPWKERIHVHHQSLDEFANASTQSYDLIVSNPPFFVNSLNAPDKSRTTARHSESLPHDELLHYSVQLLNKTGRICIILPVNEGLNCMKNASSFGLYCYQTVYVCHRPGSAAKRILLEFGFDAKLTQSSDLIIETDIRHQYSEAFTALVKNFYLKL